MAQAIWIWGLAAVSLSAAPAWAQDDELTFDPAPTATCLEAATDRAGREACIGLAAEACADSDVGSTTVGMGFCFGEEYEWWDARLNAGYREALAKDEAADAEMEGLGATVPSLVTALRAMQRAWVSFRDATCDYERAQWGGGTGGGPATASCLMRETALQALYLEERLAAQ